MTFQNKTFDFANMSQAEITETLKTHNIVLTIDEVLTIQQEMLKRPPTLTECLLWSIQSSERCSYKSSRQHLKNLPTSSPDVILGPTEDAGIVCVTKDKKGHRYGVAISHESYSHPSQTIPAEGVVTGMGGNVLDVCCMGAEVIATSESLRFGDIDDPKVGWIHDGIVSGIASYGNLLGIPNICGDLYYDTGCNDNCLVSIVTLGIVREDQIIHSYAPKNAVGYDLILVGKATDNSGFSFIEFSEKEKEQNQGTVQESNAPLEKHLLKANYALFDILREKNLISKVGFKALGGGGIACASLGLVEAGGYGAVINLDAVSTKIENLHPSVILCSAAPARFMWVVPPDITPLVLKHYNEIFDLSAVLEKAQAVVIGKITVDPKYTVQYKNTDIVDAAAFDITNGISYDRTATIKIRDLAEPNLEKLKDYSQTFLDLLAHENIASRKPIFETYDKQAQGRTIIETGRVDAGVIRPFNSEKFPEEIRLTGIALSSEHNPRYCKIDPYWGAVNTVVEAVQNVVAVGGLPLALSDCLCFGNSEKPEQMGEFVEAIRGISDTCLALKVPVIASNVSFCGQLKCSTIPASPIVSCLGKLQYVTNVVTMHFKQPNSMLLMVGKRKNECGGSAYYALYDHLGANVPKPDFGVVFKQVKGVHASINAGLVLSAHDISDGGIAVALAEMSFANSIGCDVKILGNLSDEIKLFTETGGFVLEVDENNIAKVQNILDDRYVDFEIIGRTTESPQLCMQGCIDLPISQAQKTWDEG